MLLNILVTVDVFLALLEKCSNFALEFALKNGVLEKAFGRILCNIHN